MFMIQRAINKQLEQYLSKLFESRIYLFPRLAELLCVVLRHGQRTRFINIH